MNFPRASFFLFLFLPLAAFCEKLITLGKQSEYSISRQVSFLEDPSGNLGINEVKELSENFTSSDKDCLNFGLTKYAHWVKIRIQNASGVNDWMLQVDFPQNSFIELYEPAIKGDTAIYKTGFLVPFKQRPVNSAVFLFPIEAGDNKVHEYYLKVTSDRAKIIPLSVVRTEAFVKNEAGNNLGYGIYFGIMFGLILYNLFLFFGLRDRAYLYYVFFLISSLALFAAISGKSFQYVLPEYPYANRLLIEISSALLAFFSAHFTQLFLQIKKHSNVLHWLLTGIKALAIICLVMIFTIDIRVVQPVLYFLLTADIIILLISGIVSWRKKNTYAGYFVIAWLGYMIGGMLTMGRDQGQVPFNFYTNHAAEIGSALEAVLLSLALSKRYQRYRKEKEAAIQQALNIQKEANETLEQKVEQRTIQLQETNTELNNMFQVVTEQKKEIEVKNQDITSSITYAKRIQSSILPSEETLRNLSVDHFIFYKPMHIVSGDFYWLNKKDDKVIIVVADCTGHGVPGAFMSMIGSVLLNQIINEKNITDPGIILTELNKNVQNVLKQRESESRDGMDVGICVYDKRTKTILFAGAMTPLYYIKDNVLKEIKGDRNPIGGFQVEMERTYKTHELQVDAEMSVYLSSDGYKDQFGGKDGKKFMARQFKDLLVSIHKHPINEQKEALYKANKEWMGNRYAQTDDILVAGVKLDK